MTTTSVRLPNRLANLVIKPIGNGGRFVVKNLQSGEFFQIGEEERFLLEALDGERDAEEVCTAFETEFGDPLLLDDLVGFLELARGQGLLEPAESGEPRAKSGAADAGEAVPNSEFRTPKSKRQSLLYWRKTLFDPNRFFDSLEPKIRFFWTRGFLLLSAACIVFASGVLWFNRGDVVTSFQSALRWETVVLTWLVMMVVVTLHEFAHGLTCKHYGGEVREIGFLLMFFMPCFYCNVSDAWLFREKSKRLWVTFAGGYFELFLWALTVFVWRITALDSLVNYLAFLVVVSAGVQSLFNFNPLLKLDGYYLLSDALEIPNLRQRSLQRSKAHVRRVLWGGPNPQAEPRGRFLTVFGLICWGFSAVFLVVMLFGLSGLFTRFLGSAGYALAGALAVPALLGVFQGVTGGELKRMITKRRVRTLGWLLLLGGLVTGLCFIEVDEYCSGEFTIRPATRREIRGPLAGFVKSIAVEEGDRVSPGDVIAVLEIPDLESRIAQKQAEIAEAAAQLTLLQQGTRPEKIADQRQKIARAVLQYKEAQRDLERMRKTLAAESKALNEKVSAARAKREVAQLERKLMQQAYGKQAVTKVQLERAQRELDVADAVLKQARADADARRTTGTVTAEQALFQRGQELAEERAALVLLQAGTRPQEIAAQQARLARVRAELRHLERQRSRLEIRADMAGIVVTAHLQEKVGSYVREGDVICVIDDHSACDAEVRLTEDKIAAIRPGQQVTLKARSLPFDTLSGQTIRTAQEAEGNKQSPSRVVVTCRLQPDDTSAIATLRTAMTGHARIYTGRRRSLGQLLLDKSHRLLRTEFWW